MLLGLEISRLQASAVLSDENGAAQFSLQHTFSLSATPATQWLEAMELCRNLLHRGSIESAAIQKMGICFESFVSPQGIAQNDPTRPGWEGYDLGRGAREQLHVADVVAASRAVCEGVGEARFGALRGTNDWLYLHLGTSLESALCLKGFLRLGDGRAGDIGHLIIERDGALDAFGKRGTLRAYCGGAALESRARSYSLPFSRPSDIWGLTASNFAAQSLVEDFTERLAQGLAGGLSLVETSHVCIGGAFGHAVFEPIVVPLASKLRDMTSPTLVAKTTLVPAQLGEDASVLGAVALALNPSS